MKNVVSAFMSKEDEDLALTKVQELKDLFPFLVDLGPEERRVLPKMGKKSLDFVERALIYSKEHPSLVPPYVSLEEQEKDLVLLKQIQRVLGVLDPFVDMLKDTYMQAGAEAFQAAREFYNATKRAAISGVPESSVIAKDLSEMYKKRFKSDKGDTQPGDVSNGVLTNEIGSQSKKVS